MNLLKKLWYDDSGALIATEWIMVATIMVLGVASGLYAVRDAVNDQFYDFGNTFRNVVRDNRPVYNDYQYQNTQSYQNSQYTHTEYNYYGQPVIILAQEAPGDPVD